jgi:hypothetical protein
MLTAACEEVDYSPSVLAILASHRLSSFFRHSKYAFTWLSRSMVQYRCKPL